MKHPCCSEFVCHCQLWQMYTSLVSRVGNTYIHASKRMSKSTSTCIDDFAPNADTANLCQDCLSARTIITYICFDGQRMQSHILKTIPNAYSSMNDQKSTIHCITAQHIVSPHEKNLIFAIASRSNGTSTAVKLQLVQKTMKLQLSAKSHSAKRLVIFTILLHLLAQLHIINSHSKAAYSPWQLKFHQFCLLVQTPPQSHDSRTCQPNALQTS